MNKRSGFSLIESLLVLIMMTLIMSAIYMMIMYYRDVSGTEQARVRQTQESRYLLSVFSSELKNAGAVMTLANTGGFLTTPPYFNGIYPLNNTGFADGVILASADPNAVSKLVDAVDPASDTVLPVNNLVANPAWAIGEKGILIGPNGFYVFAVASVGTNSITMEDVPVYYSGLLNTANYSDPATPKGNAVSYPAGAPVMRLGEFSIYLVQERGDGRRDLVRVSDCNGQADVLSSGSTATRGVIATNIWDLQLVYSAYPGFPDVSTKVSYFTYGASGTLDELLNALRLKTMKEVTVSVVSLTDDFPGRGEITYPLPLLADRSATSLPTGKFSFKTYSFLVQPRNFNIKM